MSTITRTGPLLLLGLFCANGSVRAQAATANWIITLSAKQNPLPLGQCTPIELTVVEGMTGRPPVRPDGKQVDWQDFDLNLTAQPLGSFDWSDPQHHRFLCARAPASTTALVVASYPAQHLGPNEKLTGVAQGLLQVGQIGPTTVAVAPQPAGAPPAYSQQPASPQAQPYQQQTGAPAVAQIPGQPQASGQPVDPAVAVQAGVPPAGGQQPPAAAQPPGVYSQQQQGQQQGAYVPQQQGPYVPQQQGAYAPQQQPGSQPQPDYQTQQPSYQNQAPQPTTAGPGPTPAVAVAPTVPAEPKKKGGFFQKLGKHLKDKANEVTSQTAQNLTASATQVVDATAQTGSNLVSGATAQASAAAQSKVGSVGTSLVPGSLRLTGNADNLELAVKSGQAVLPMIHFGDNNAVLDASSLMFVAHLADVLKRNPNPAGYLIRAYVDPAQSGSDQGQKLSEDRAAAVKAVLERNQVPGILKALGYGVGQATPDLPSARIEVWKLQ